MTKRQAIAEAKKRWPALRVRLELIPPSLRPCVLIQNSWSRLSWSAIGGGATWEDAIEKADSYLRAHSTRERVLRYHPRARFQVPKGVRVNVVAQYGEQTATYPDWLVISRVDVDSENETTIRVVSDEVAQKWSDQIR